MTTTEPIMDVQTYLNRQNDQLRMQRTIESITPSQEDIDLRPAPHIRTGR